MKSDNTNNKEQYPIELPTREGKTSHTPITDVVENEIFPLDFKSAYGSARRNSGVQVSDNSIAEVITTEVFPEK